MLWYHCSKKPLDLKIIRDLSLAPRLHESLPYLKEARGWATCVEVGVLAEADEDEITRVAEQLGLEDDYVYEYADDPDVQEVLRAAGFTAMRYWDLGPDNRYEHDCLRLIASVPFRVVAEMPV
jgi:hypothetical protein